MPLDPKTVQRIVRKKVGGRKQVDPSFVIELINYTRRVGLEPLDESQLETVVAEIAADGLESPEPRLGAEEARRMITQRCRRGPFHPCEGAAQGVFEDLGVASAAGAIEDRLTAVVREIEEAEGGGDG